MNTAKNINDIYIVSQNARGLKSDDKLRELTSTIKSLGYFAICIQETWRSGVENFELNGYHFIFNGLDKNLNTSRRGEQGVAIALSPKATLAWKVGGSIVYNNFGARILAVPLLRKNNTGIFLISAYAPIGMAGDTVLDDFLYKLDRCICKKNAK